MYRTSDAEGEKLLPVGITEGTTLLPPRSITTLVSLLSNKLKIDN